MLVACISACVYLFYQSFGVFFASKHAEVIIIDKSLTNYQELARESGNAQVILVENTDTGFSQLNRDLRKLGTVKRLHILTHGTSGNFVLGRQQLNENNINQFKSFWTEIARSLSPKNSELLIYSCQLANGREGKSFVNRLHDLLGVTVAGSEDNTGSSQKGGNWDLEFVSGKLIKNNVLKYLNFNDLLIPYFSGLYDSASPFYGMPIYNNDQLIYGDFDADGDIDLHVYPYSGAPENIFWRNNGSGSFSQVSGAANPFNNITEKAVFHTAKYAYVADWDNDGDDDIFVTKRSSSGENIFYKNINGVYQEFAGASSPFDLITISGDDQLIYGDFDNDGDIDIHSYPGGSADNEFWRNNGSGQFSKVTGTANPFRNLGSQAAFYASAEYARVADWDNDGDADILVTKRNIGSATGENFFYRNDNGTFVEIGGTSSPFKNIAIVQDKQFIYGDFDSDGDIDIQASSSNAVTTLKYWQNNGSGIFTDVTGTNNPFNNIPNNGAFYNDAGKAFVADWDNDKDVDILVTRRTADAQNILFKQTDAPPQLTISTPANTATGVSIEANIVLNFSRAVSGVSGKNIVIKRVSDNSTFATIGATGAQVTGGGSNTIVINPTSDLEATRGYYLLVDKGAFADTDGRIFTGINNNSKLSFTTGAAPTIPVLTTTGINTFDTNSATMGGNVTSDGGKVVNDRGIVWSTSTAPTIASNKIAIGSGTGTFSQSVSALPSGTRIFVRAYATNAIGTAYGNEIDFYTKTTVSTIVKSDLSPTNAGTVGFNVTFADNLTGLDASDFSVATNGITGAYILSVTGTGKTYSVLLNTGTGNGTLRLDFTGTASTQPNVASAFTAGEVYDIYKISTATNYYRTKTATANWNQAGSWESSADNSFWITATAFPNASTTTVSVLPNQAVSLPSGFNSTTGNLTNSGTIDLNSNILTVTGSFSNTGTLKGNGTFVNTNFSNSGTISPGSSPGTLSFNGNLVNNGTLNLEIGGNVAGSTYDQVLVSGTMTFSGTLNVTFINGYTPVTGDEFTVIDAASSSGVFASVNLPNIAPRVWETTYNNSNGTLILRINSDPLPVKLVSFQAKKREFMTDLFWETTFESNSSHFEIERSAKGINWEVIGKKDAVTESIKRQQYAYIDVSPESGENLYRLKMIDMDGTYAYSKISSVTFDKQYSDIRIYPNPVSEKLFLDIPDQHAVKKLDIISLSGIVVSSTTAYTKEGISVGSLLPGLYILNFSTSAGQSISQRFMKE